MEITYKTIKSLIKKEELQNGNQINLEFQAQNQETPISTVAVIVPNTKDITKNVGKEIVKSTVKRGIINGILSSLGLSGLLGSAVRQTVNEVSRGSSSTNIISTKISDADKQNAIVNAFKPFMMMYKYNEQNSEWEYIS